MMLCCAVRVYERWKLAGHWPRRRSEEKPDQAKTLPLSLFRPITSLAHFSLYFLYLSPVFSRPPVCFSVFSDSPFLFLLPCFIFLLFLHFFLLILKKKIRHLPFLHLASPPPPRPVPPIQALPLSLSIVRFLGQLILTPPPSKVRGGNWTPEKGKIEI
jgi:hypothetical protein